MMPIWVGVVLVLLFIAGSIAACIYGYDWGKRAGWQEAMEKIDFKRRELPPVEGFSRQPHARHPGGTSRVSDAHMSQPRADWRAE